MFEITLNLLWVAIGLAALGALAVAEVCRRDAHTSYWSLRLMAVVLAVVFLFPCVSSSDDLLTLQDLQISEHIELSSEEPNTTPQDGRTIRHLERLFENLQTFQIAAAEPAPSADRAFAMPPLSERTAPQQVLSSTSGTDPPAPALS